MRHDSIKARAVGSHPTVLPDTYTCERCGLTRDGRETTKICSDCRPFVSHDKSRRAAAWKREKKRRACSPGCTLSRHDHFNDDGTPMFCEDCDLPTHYDYDLELYRHDDPSQPDCWLGHGSPA